MQPHIQTLAKLLTTQDLKGLLNHYMNSAETENMAQLGFMYQQAQKNPPAYDYYQQLTTSFIEAKKLPNNLIARINNADALSFFTPAFKVNFNFNRVDQHKRNAIHYLFAGSSAQTQQQPPFNYLRSMMLFESNEALSGALGQRESNHLTPIELYFATNPCLQSLPAHEFTALLAIIEIEGKQQAVEQNNFLPVVRAVNKLCQAQYIEITPEQQRLVLLAAYYTKSTNQIIDAM